MAGGRRYSFKTEDDGNIIPLIGILVVLIILVAGALYFVVTSGAGEPEGPPVAPPVKPNVTEPPPQTNLTNETNVTAVCGDDCHYQNALLNESAEECKLIEEAGLTETCYEELADVSLAACLEVDDQSKKDFCVTSFALSKDDITLCDLLDDARQSCRVSVDSCIGSEEEELCRALKDDDPSLCESETACLLDYSAQEQDPEACALIQNPVVAIGCESAIRNTDKCYDLASLSQRDYCYQIYAQISDDYKVCTSISLNTAYRLNCLSSFAASEANYSICTEGMLQLDDRWACYTNYSLITGDISGCEAIDELATTNRFRCSFEYAKKYGDPSACQVVESLASRTTCYEGVIIYSSENLDGQYCKYVTDFIWRNKCYNEAAKKMDDISLCDEITESFAKQACIDAYNLAKG